ncbi:MAG TPA: hypothetical protein VNP04_01800, partial [Alphaproteobacteria bacterium]|nr:hypothetical protein [Alphaproteobacteria bacterium]
HGIRAPAMGEMACNWPLQLAKDRAVMNPKTALARSKSTTTGVGAALMGTFSTACQIESLLLIRPHKV